MHQAVKFSSEGLSGWFQRKRGFPVSPSPTMPKMRGNTKHGELLDFQI